MNKKLFAVVALGALVAGCQNNTVPNPPAKPNEMLSDAFQHNSYGTSGSDSFDHSNSDVDNTRINVRDRDQTLTPENQSESFTDRNITAAIRKFIVSDNSLSTNAKNVKIITVNGVVTLRGPVNTTNEKIIIVKKVRDISGVKNVNDQLEVISK